MTTTSKPTTAAAANKLLTELSTKRAALTATLNSSAERRKAFTVAAEFGDDGAKESLRQIAAEDSQARDALENLDIVVSQMKAIRDELAADEATAREIESAAEVDAAVDALLEIDDEIDEIMDRARALLERRRELLRDPVLRRAKTKFAGALVNRAQEAGSSIMQYFDFELAPWSTGQSYAGLTRLAEWDGNHFQKVSPGVAARPPRELTMVEKNMRRSTMSVSSMAGNGGFDSQVENDKFHAAGGRKRAIDVSGGYPAAGGENPPPARARAIDDREFERRMIFGKRAGA